MSEDVSRRAALSLLWAALGLALATTEDAEAEAARTKSHHTRHPTRSTVQRASAPAEAAPAEFKPIKSPSSLEMEMQSTGTRAPLHPGDETN